ncbi:MAG: hypothetical protein PHQ43_01780 [Dehalococcoidales bacterium]|nr:hypothetical protein [Dehalococcoidales bacterium]
MAYIYEAYRVWSPLDVGAIDDVGRNVISWSATTLEDTGITVSAGLSDAIVTLATVVTLRMYQISEYLPRSI